MSKNPELKSIERQIASENERHRQRIEQLRQQKQRIKDTQARKQEQEKIKKSYNETILELSYLLF